MFGFYLQQILQPRKILLSKNVQGQKTDNKNSFQKWRHGCWWRHSWVHHPCQAWSSVSQPGNHVLLQPDLQNNFHLLPDRLVKVTVRRDVPLFWYMWQMSAAALSLYVTKCDQKAKLLIDWALDSYLVSVLLPLNHWLADRLIS